jgi:membrane protein YqaA with SNARE-associated domain
MALSWVGFSHPLGVPLIAALIAAVASTSGRLVLARLSRVIIRNRFMSDTMRGNVDVIKEQIEQHRKLTFAAFLVYAFSPFPSSYLFIAYGLTPLPLRLVAIPFFIGRTVSYSFFVFIGAEVSKRLALKATDAQSYFGAYFLITQFALLGVVFVFAHIDWRHVVTAKRFRWLRTVNPGRQ